VLGNAERTGKGKKIGICIIKRRLLVHNQMVRRKRVILYLKEAENHNLTVSPGKKANRPGN